MSATACYIFNELRRHHVTVERHGDRLKLRAAVQPPIALLEQVRAHKADLLAMLKARADDYEERAGILEYDAGLDRADAERVAAQLVYCRDCQHFTPDPINPGAGLGCCAAGWELHGGRGPLGGASPPYPMAPRYCRAWLKQ